MVEFREQRLCCFVKVASFRKVCCRWESEKLFLLEGKNKDGLCNEKKGGTLW